MSCPAAPYALRKCDIVEIYRKSKYIEIPLYHQCNGSIKLLYNTGMKSDAQLKILAMAAAAKKDKTVESAGEVNYKAYNAGTSPYVAIDVVGLKQNYRVQIDPKTGKVGSVTPREKPREGGRYQ